MSLGYSLGDFIAGANMTYRLIRALSETKGACMEYQEAMSELGALQQTFLQVGYLRPSHTLCQATINAAAFIVLSSVEMIGEFLRKTQKYRKRLGRAGTGHAVSDSWQKMGWVLFKREELKALKDNLHLRFTNIGVLLSTAEIHGKIPYTVVQFEERSSCNVTRAKDDDKMSGSLVQIEEKHMESPCRMKDQEESPYTIAQFEDKPLRTPFDSDDQASIPDFVASFIENNAEADPTSEENAYKIKRHSVEKHSTAANDPTLIRQTTLLSNIPTSQPEPNAQPKEKKRKSVSFSEDQRTKMEPSTAERPSTAPTENHQILANEITRLETTSSYLPDLAAGTGKAQPRIEEKDQKAPGQWEEISYSPLLSSKYLNSWVEVDGKLVPSTNGKPLQPIETSESVGPSLKTLNPGATLSSPGNLENDNDVQALEKVTHDQSLRPAKPSNCSATHTVSKTEAKDIQNGSKVQPQVPTKTLSGSQLISQLETILRETGNIKVVKPTKFRDAVGRKFSFPWELASTWAGMQELIHQAFLHVEGLGPHVMEGHYDLIGPNGEIILPKVWETTIEPDTNISMHMWPMPEPPRGHPPPPPPSNWPNGSFSQKTNKGLGVPPVIVNLTRQHPVSKSKSRREPAKGVLAWMAGPSKTNYRGRSYSPPRRHSSQKSKGRGWIQRVNKILSKKEKEKDEHSDSDSYFSDTSSVSISSAKKTQKRR